MNASAYPVSNGLAEYGLPPILIAASSERAGARAAETAEQAGYPFFTVPIGSALERLEVQAGASAVWIEVEDDEPALDHLLDRLNNEVASGCYPAEDRSRYSAGRRRQPAAGGRRSRRRSASF